MDVNAFDEYVKRRYITINYSKGKLNQNLLQYAISNDVKLSETLNSFTLEINRLFRVSQISIHALILLSFLYIYNYNIEITFLHRHISTQKYLPNHL